MTVGDHIAAFLAEKGVSHAFGITGAGNLPQWDAIARGQKIQLVCTHHEQAAAMAATYFNRTCGALKAIAIVTTGAGSTNAITGALAANMDSIPLLVLSGNEPSETLTAGTRVLGVQGYDSSGAAKSFTKWQNRLWSADEYMTDLVLDEMWQAATTPRAGVSWLDLPRDIAAAEVT